MKSVVITGASSGIGQAAAKHCAAAGWRVFALVLPQDDVTALNMDNIIILPMDLIYADSIQQTAEKIGADVGDSGLQGLVNNAGINMPGVLEALPIDDLRRQFEVNVFGHLRLTQAILPLLRLSKHARIVNISSIMGKVAMPTLGAYSMSKHALEAMTDILRLELAPEIAVSAIEPGAVQTPMTDAMPALLETAQAKMSDTLHQNYAGIFAGMKHALRTQAKNAIAPEIIVECIWHALTADQPKPRYVPGAAAQGLLLMRKFAPEAVGDMILRRVLGIK